MWTWHLSPDKKVIVEVDEESETRWVPTADREAQWQTRDRGETDAMTTDELLDAWEGAADAIPEVLDTWRAEHMTALEERADAAVGSASDRNYDDAGAELKQAAEHVDMLEALDDIASDL